MKLSVAKCLPLLISAPTDKQCKAAELVRSCQQTAQLDKTFAKAWRIDIPLSATLGTQRGKLELGKAELDSFMGSLLAPVDSPATAKVDIIFVTVTLPIPCKFSVMCSVVIANPIQLLHRGVSPLSHICLL